MRRLKKTSLNNVETIFYPKPFCMASKLKCILSLAKTKYFFATIFCRYISFNVIEAILSENLLIAIFFKFYSQLSSRIMSISFQKQASCA